MAQGKQHKPTKELRKAVERMKAVQITNEQIAYCLEITEKTLVKHYSEQLQFGKANVLQAISGKLVQKAMAGDNACMFFYLKTREGWRETQEVEHTNLPKLQIEVLKPKAKKKD